MSAGNKFSVSGVMSCTPIFTCRSPAEVQKNIIVSSKIYSVESLFRRFVFASSGGSYHSRRNDEDLAGFDLLKAHSGFVSYNLPVSLNH